MYTVAAYSRLKTRSPSWSAWSEGRQLPSCVYIRQLNWVNCHNGCAIYDHGTVIFFSIN